MVNRRELAAYRQALAKRQGHLEVQEGLSRNREVVAGKRECAVSLREEVASLREEIIALREQAARDIDHALEQLGARNEELREANANLVSATLDSQRMAEQADDARTQQDRFLAMLSHELRNPLEPIRSAVDVLGGVASTDPLLPWVREVVARQVAHMARLLDDLLDTSRITRGAVKLQRRPVALAEFVEFAVETCTPLINRRKQTLAVDMPSEPVYVDGDPLRLAQMLGNLLHNATKYAQEGGTIALSGRVEDHDVAVYVKDDGCGISAAVLPTVFDLFTQEETSLSRSRGGLGIGLAVVRSMAELHGGTVEARSDGPNQGSEFVLRLPRLQFRPDEAPEPTERPARVSPQGLSVLLVDDDADANDMMAKVLEMAGYSVTQASDGVEALERIRNEAPDVVVCDIGLPGLDGYAVAQCVSAATQTSRPVMIAVTGYGRPEDRERALAAGFDHHLVKPVDPALLRRTMAEGRETE